MNMGTKKTTMQDIADSLGYSRTTVSKALNNASGISEKTREITKHSNVTSQWSLHRCCQKLQE